MYSCRLFSYQVAVGKHDVRVQTGGRHTEIEGHPQINFAFRTVIDPLDVFWLLTTKVAKVFT